MKQINQVDREGCCPLVHAAASGHAEAVMFLLQCDWSQLRDKQPTRTEALQQALSAAAKNGHFAVCTTANVNIAMPQHKFSCNSVCVITGLA